MSDCYTPRIDGIFDGTDTPSRDPLTGQFLSSTPGYDDPAWHDLPINYERQFVPIDEIASDPTSLSAENWTLKGIDGDEDNCFDIDGLPDHFVNDTYDTLPCEALEEKYSLLAKRHGITSYDDYDDFNRTTVEAGLNPADYWSRDQEDFDLVVQRWVKVTYDEPIVHFDDMGSVDFEPSDKFGLNELEQLPSHQNLLLSMTKKERFFWDGGYWGESHGRHGRLNGVKLSRHRQIRKARKGTRRQMDKFWVFFSADESILDAHASMSERDVDSFIEQHDEAFRRNDLAYKNGDFDQENGSSGLFSDIDYLLDDDDYFDGRDDYWRDDMDYNSHVEEPYNDDFSLNGQPSNLLGMDDYYISQEVWKVMEAEDRALEEAAEALEMETRFEHLPAINATGKKARLAYERV